MTQPLVTGQEEQKVTDNSKSRLVEALIFASPEPINSKDIAELITGLAPEAVQRLVDTLNQEYEDQDRAFRILNGAGGFRYTTLPEYSPWVKRLVVGSGRIRLSRASLETVSLIAYRQPVSRTDVEAIRGVDVGGVLRMLVERKLIAIQGRSSKPGKARLYVTTPKFLRHFGLNSIDDLPRPSDALDDDDLDDFGEVEQTQLDLDSNEPEQP